jgi:hypothetical protein
LEIGSWLKFWIQRCAKANKLNLKVRYTPEDATRYLMEHGYQIIPVNPTASEILGAKVYPDLAFIPRKIDVVQVFQ